jgi:hypothetical protein
MIAIVCLAIALAILVAINRRAVHFVQTAEYHRKEAVRLQLQRRTLAAAKSAKGMDQGMFEAEDYHLHLRARDHLQMAAKYRAAASHPWLPVESDPPKPEP